MNALCWFCSESGRIRLGEWWAADGTPLCSSHALALYPERFAEDVRVSKAYL